MARIDPSHSHGSAKNPAPGRPGVRPTWSPAAKSGVGCAASAASRLWFTIGRGIVNEVYHPWVDHVAIRDMGLIVTGPDGFFSEEQADCCSDTLLLEPGVPAYRLENQCRIGRYRIIKEIIVDPQRDVLLQRVQFVPLVGSLIDYHLHVLLAARLGDEGEDNTGSIGSYRHHPMLFAHHSDYALAVSGSAPWLHRSAGFVGVTDAWQDLKQHGRMTWEYDRAAHGNVAVAGEIDLQSCDGQFILATAFDRSTKAAGLNATLSLQTSFEVMKKQFIEEWQSWHRLSLPLDDAQAPSATAAEIQQRQKPDRSRPQVKMANAEDHVNLYRTSMMVLRVNRSKHYRGASVASLSSPWGEARGEKDSGGYHLVWGRDLAESAAGWIAAGSLHEAQHVLNYLRATQKHTGGWPQDMWLDGTPYASGVQLDEAALPILLHDLASRQKVITEKEAREYWPMLRSAAAFIIRSGPSTGQDRWENTPGLSPYTLATEIAALVLAAESAKRFNEQSLAHYFLETADAWNDAIERWAYVTGIELAHRVGLEGYYVRIADSPGMQTLLHRGPAPREKQAHNRPSTDIVSPDALALVRYGLRAADDQRIVNTVKAIDALCRFETPAGPCWRRYNGDYYGETNEGAPFTGAQDHKGHGRGWPLLTGERGHYEIAAGRLDEARRLVAAMGGFASQIGLLPEQIWDTDDVPHRDLYRGRPSGSAMPLLWTHSEYIRLLRSVRDERVFDCPPSVRHRYAQQRTGSDLAIWRFDHQVALFPKGYRVRLEVVRPARVRFTLDNWKTHNDLPTRDTGIGLHVADLPTATMAAGETLEWTFCWPADDDRWEGRNFSMIVYAGNKEKESSSKPVATKRVPRQRASMEHSQ